MTPALLHSANSGELLAAEIQVPSRLLEEILEVLASAPFPINPELEHSTSPVSTVRFPLYEAQRDELQEILATNGLAPSLLNVKSMMQHVVADYEATL
ncbi:MAG: hypothetical protein FJW36_05055 [Acidobacteria bacterium]|nr:hypothetical protein [Acidobacteriota bacterium]